MFVSQIDSAPTAAPQRCARSEARPDRSWRTVVWDDPINLMGYVTRVFREHFGYSQQTAQNLMLDVHRRGRAIVSTGPRERMEADVAAMHRYGLQATLEENHD